MGLEISVHQDGSEVHPVRILPLGRRDDAVKAVRCDAATLADEGRIEERVKEAGTAAEGRFGAKLFEDQLLDRVVEQTPASSDAGLAIAPEQLPEKTVVEIGAIRKPHARGKGFVVGRRHSRWNTRIARNYKSRWTVRERT